MATSPAASLRQTSLHSFFSQKPPNDDIARHTPPPQEDDPRTPNAAENQAPAAKRKRPLDSNCEPPKIKNAVLKHLHLPADPITDYERQRQENIRKNNEFFKNLGISAPLEVLRKTTAPRPRIKPPEHPQALLPLRRSARRRRGREGKENTSEDVPEGRTRDLPVEVIRYDDSSVVKYVCSAPSDSGAGTVTSGSLVGFRRVGRNLADPLLTRIYSADVAVVDGSESALLAAAGHAGRISIYGTSISYELEEKSSSEETEGPLMTWKGSPSWISSVTFLRQQGQVSSVVLLLSSANDGRLTLWDIGKEPSSNGGLHLAAPPIVAQVDTLHTKGIFGMQEFNGKIATASKDSSVGFSSFRECGIAVERSFSGHHYGPVKGICFRDSNILADCGADNRICILDIRLADSCTLTIESNHRSGVNVVEWCPNQEFLVLSASKDPELLLYDIRSHREPLHILEGHVDPKYSKCYQIYRPAFVGTGMAVATPGQGSRQISLYSTNEGKAISRGFVGYDANLVMCNVRDKLSSQRVWLASKQITQLSPIWQDIADDSD